MEAVLGGAQGPEKMHTVAYHRQGATHRYLMMRRPAGDCGEQKGLIAGQHSEQWLSCWTDFKPTCPFLPSPVPGNVRAWKAAS